MNKDTFKHGKFYKITKYGRINPNFPSVGNKPVILSGKGEYVWFVGLAWKKRTLEGEKIIQSNDAQTCFYLIATNYYTTERVGCPVTIYITHREIAIFKKYEIALYKRYRVKQIEPFTLEQFPLLVSAKTTTLFTRLLKGEISPINFPDGIIV